MLIFKTLLSAAFTLYTFLILIRIFGSWFPQWQNHPIMRIVAKCTDPYLNLFKKFIPRLGMIDLSPMVAMLALYFVEGLLLRYL